MAWSPSPEKHAPEMAADSTLPLKMASPRFTNRLVNSRAR
eukprot:CAMPEP_0168464878 /NCGR_PEP_ID=MMETSP0228-20121227/55813_1 /TAXON_ID=133427 /ORGANISM="Protoceratium reticulatum, Strain CCCM 535 (=CCMP 1889)" /LENGTH=39 /DNA_ID= /DNA_START= /DNA_END= /DNA_ORIENTATION=